MLTFHSALTSSPTASTLLARYFDERGRTFPDAQGAYTVSFPDAARFVPPNGDFVVVLLDEVPVGCGGVRRLRDAVADEDGTLPVFEVKHVFVDPAARGSGAGRALLNDVERRAIALGARRLVLDTHESLAAAGHLYRTSGYHAIEPYNDNPNATHWYAKDVGA